MSSMSAFIALLVVLAVVFLALKLRALVHHGILGPFGIRLGHGHHVTDSSGFDDSSELDDSSRLNFDSSFSQELLDILE